MKCIRLEKAKTQTCAIQWSLDASRSATSFIFMHFFGVYAKQCDREILCCVQTGLIAFQFVKIKVKYENTDSFPECSFV